MTLQQSFSVSNAANELILIFGMQRKMRYKKLLMMNNSDYLLNAKIIFTVHLNFSVNTEHTVRNVFLFI
jgi:hypothetical protein